MSWSIGYDDKWKRDIGYGVPAFCDHPDCGKEIHRGLSYVCGGEAYGGEHGCGLYFCEAHRAHCEVMGLDVVPLCERCGERKEPFTPSPEHPEWIHHKLTDESWKEWREQNPEAVRVMQELATP